MHNDEFWLSSSMLYTHLSAFYIDNTIVILMLDRCVIAASGAVGPLRYRIGQLRSRPRELNAAGAVLIRILQTYLLQLQSSLIHYIPSFSKVN